MLGPGQVDRSGVWGIILQILAVMVLAALAQWVLSVCNNKITFSVTRDLRNDAIHKIQSLPLSYLDSPPRRGYRQPDGGRCGHLRRRPADGLYPAVLGSADHPGTLLFMFRENVLISLVVVLITPLSLVVAAFIANHSYGYFHRQSAVRGEQTALVNEMIEGQKNR